MAREGWIVWYIFLQGSLLISTDSFFLWWAEWGTSIHMNCHWTRTAHSKWVNRWNFRGSGLGACGCDAMICISHKPLAASLRPFFSHITTSTIPPFSLLTPLAEVLVHTLQAYCNNLSRVPDCQSCLPHLSIPSFPITVSFLKSKPDHGTRGLKNPSVSPKCKQDQFQNLQHRISKTLAWALPYYPAFSPAHDIT